MKSTIPTWKEYNNNQQFNIDKEELMSLPKYNPDDIKESNFEPDVAGEYFFDVKEASDAGKSGTGFDKTKIVLSVDTGKRTAKVIVNLTSNPAAAWVVDAFYKSLGINDGGESLQDYDDLLGMSGKANFTMEPGYSDPSKSYLNASTFISKGSAGLNSKSVAAEVFKTPEKIADVPF